MSVSVIPRDAGPWTGATGADLMALIPVLATAFAFVLGAVALVTGWQSFNERMPRRRRRGVVVPRVGVIARDSGGVR